MIEIPLKGVPTCIAIGKSVGGFGIAVDDTLLVYSHVQKQVAETDLVYRYFICSPVEFGNNSTVGLGFRHFWRNFFSCSFKKQHSKGR